MTFAHYSDALRIVLFLMGIKILTIKFQLLTKNINGY